MAMSLAKKIRRAQLAATRHRRGAQYALQSRGANRHEARRVIFGDTRREATRHATRGQLLNDRIRANAAGRRSRRAQVLAATFTGALVEGGL